MLLVESHFYKLRLLKGWIFNIGLLIVLIDLSGCTYSSPAPTTLLDRYELSGFNGLNILLDKQTGKTWRNVRCDDEGQKTLTAPNCWQSMDYIDFAPKAEAEAPLGKMDAVIQQATVDSQSANINQE